MGVPARCLCLMLALASGCVRASGFTCATDQQCGGGTCEPTGGCSAADPTCSAPARRYSDLAPGALAGMCVGQASVVDGSVRDAADGAAGDGGPADGALDGAADAGLDGAPSDGAPIDGTPIDGTPIDAATMMGDSAVDAAVPDAAPPGPSADRVLGQADFMSRGVNAGGYSARSMDFPRGVASDGSHLWVADADNYRVMQWNALPTADHQVADVAVGQVSLTGTPQFGPTQALISQSPTNAASDGTHLLIADNMANRVLIWNSIPTTSDQMADLVLGQTSFTFSVAGKAANSLDTPTGMWTGGGKLVVVDSGNDRVLIWNSFPTASHASADVVLGRSGFGLGRGDPQPTPPSASSLLGPTDVSFDGTHLWVADFGNHRVLGWVGIPTVSGTPATIVIGQQSLTDGSAHPGPTADGFTAVAGVTVAAGRLYVADSVRVLAFSLPVPATGASAVACYGQDSCTSAAPLLPTTAYHLASAGGISIAGGRLWVADANNNRVLGFPVP